jgi:hypothetical protein
MTMSNVYDFKTGKLLRETPPIPVDSSVIKSVDYKRRTMLIEFNSGNKYKYKGIPRNLFDAFKNAPSIGQYFNRYIKDKYQFERVM